MYALAAHRTEITEYHIYKRLARKNKNEKNAGVSTVLQNRKNNMQVIGNQKPGNR